MKAAFRRINKYVPLGPMIIYSILPIAALIHVISVFSQSFADFFNIYIASAFRAVMAFLTGWMPFSFAETIFLSLPVMLIVAVFCIIPNLSLDRAGCWRYVTSLLSVIAFIYIMFVLTLGTGYQGSSVTEKLGLERRGITADELYETAVALTEAVNEESKNIVFDQEGSSVMPYTVGELNRKLNDAYIKASKKYSFIAPLRSHVKSVALSEPMTYTHIAGVYTFFTGEANVNINFPDYTLPYTMAHEMSHQRGIAPEDEANFMAYLICMESDDPYIRYCGSQNLLEYIFSALSRADRERYSEVFYMLDQHVINEIRAYNDFFEKYEDNVVADVSGTINNTYLTLQGTAGTRSYGLVADLAVIGYVEGFLKFEP